MLKTIEHDIHKDRQIYFIQIEGSSAVNGVDLHDGDAMEIVDISKLFIEAKSDAHFLFIEMDNA